MAVYMYNMLVKKLGGGGGGGGACAPCAPLVPTPMYSFLYNVSLHMQLEALKC